MRVPLFLAAVFNASVRRVRRLKVTRPVPVVSLPLRVIRRTACGLSSRRDRMIRVFDFTAASAMIWLVRHGPFLAKELDSYAV